MNSKVMQIVELSRLTPFRKIASMDVNARLMKGYNLMSPH